ncbi:MAG: SUMF1/EgtB/PvdO family nonheme iron enzyme [Bacteroidales bacterium]|nr:SUMF1/EgtB/PvdO family nonheme iron enzyme [Candidatus Liminaster caballi]
MIRTFLTSLLMMLCVALHAQIAVESFTPLENDLTAIMKETQVIDYNDDPCALIKIETTQTGFTFNMGRLPIMKTEQHVGEIWVYVMWGANRISIFHQQLGVLRDYSLGMSVQKGRTYLLKLTTGTVETIVHEAREKTGWLIINSEPQGAMVYVNEEYAGNTPLTGLKQKYGKYTYRLELANYHNSAGMVQIDSPRVELNIPMKPAFGSIRVESSETGAMVLLDGKPTGFTAPCTLTEVSSGIHDITVQKEKYAPERIRVEVRDGETVSASAMLTARFAQVEINTLQDAQIFIDGALRSTTRCVENLMDGYHDVEVRLAHHRSSSRQIQVIAGEPQTLTLNPTPIYGSLDVVSTPYNAEVSIDGRPVGRTPLSIDQLLEGDHTVVFTLGGYAPETKIINVSEGQSASLSATLQNGRNVTVSAEQANDQIYIDDNLVGSHSFSGSLTFGSHTAYALRGGEKSSVQTFNVQQGGADPAVALAFGPQTQTFTVNGVSFKMVAVKGGTFQMGATPEQQDADDDEKPVHSVTLSDYCIGETEVTQALWKAVMGETVEQIAKRNGWNTFGVGDNYPMYDVSWDDCQTFIKKLNQLTGKNFRLPTEAEWEYAARGGKESKDYQYSGSNDINAVAWYTSNSNRKTHAVKTKQPNELGLYDMSGNVWEWCQDWKDSYSSGSQTNPKGPASGSYRVFRGGSWFNHAGLCRVANRGRSAPVFRDGDLGLRLSL